MGRITGSIEILALVSTFIGRVTRVEAFSIGDTSATGRTTSSIDIDKDIIKAISQRDHEYLTIGLDNETYLPFFFLDPRVLSKPFIMP